MSEETKQAALAVLERINAEEAERAALIMRSDFCCESVPCAEMNEINMLRELSKISSDLDSIRSKIARKNNHRNEKVFAQSVIELIKYSLDPKKYIYEFCSVAVSSNFVSDKIETIPERRKRRLREFIELGGDFITSGIDIQISGKRGALQRLAERERASGRNRSDRSDIGKELREEFRRQRFDIKMTK